MDVRSLQEKLQVDTHHLEDWLNYAEQEADDIYALNCFKRQDESRMAVSTTVISYKICRKWLLKWKGYQQGGWRQRNVLIRSAWIAKFKRYAGKKIKAVNFRLQ